MEESWALLPAELLARVFRAHADLSMRLVCKPWSRGCAALICAMHVSSPPWRRRIREDEVARLAAFENLRALKLDCQGGPCLMLALPSLPLLSSLQLTPILRIMSSLANLATRLPSLVSLHLSVSSAEQAGIVIYALARQLPCLEQLTLACEGPEAAISGEQEAEEGLGLRSASLEQWRLRTFSIQGCMGLGEEDIEALAMLRNLSELDAQLSTAEAFWALAELTQLTRLSVHDWNPGPLPCEAILALEQFSALSSLRSLSLTHTFGVSERILLDGVKMLTQLQHLELLISSGVETFVQDIKGLSSLTAQFALNLPFDQELDLQPLTSLTRLQFQEVMPVISDDGEIAIDRPPIPLTCLAPLTELRELRFQDGADVIDAHTLTALLQLLHLTALHFACEFNRVAWSVAQSQKWTDVLGQLTGLQELAIEGCTTLTLLTASALSRLTKLLLHECPLLRIEGVSALTSLRILGLRHSPLAAPTVVAALPVFTQLRSLGLQACAIGSDGDIALLCAATTLTSLDVRSTLISATGVCALEQLPYLRRLSHNTA